MSIGRIIIDKCSAVFPYKAATCESLRVNNIFDDIHKYHDDKVIILSTGAQGEENASLMKIANGMNRSVQVRPGDTIMFSSSVIPGNERAVNETIDRLFQVGAEVVTAADRPIHASGHGHAERTQRHAHRCYLS